MFYCLAVYIITDWMFKNYAVRNGGVGGQMGKSQYAMGGRSKRTSACNWGGGSNFCQCGAYVLIE